MDISILPSVNAVLNASSGVLILTGYSFIRKKKIGAHRACMVSAVIVSVLFLISYVVYHYNAGTTRFAGTGWVRPLYFFILTSHTILAVVTVPLVVVTIRRAVRLDIARHRRLARWTFPIWLYVSITGVIVYLMLYHLYPSR